MNKDRIKRRRIWCVCLTILIILINYILLSSKSNNLVNSEDGVVKLIVSLGFIFLPCSFIAIIIQVIELVIAIINKIGKQSLNIAELVIEIIYFIFTFITVIPIMFFNFSAINENLCLLVVVFEFINIYILVLIIKMLIIGKKESGRNDRK